MLYLSIKISINLTQSWDRTHIQIYKDYRNLFPERYNDFIIEDPYANNEYTVHLETKYRVPGLGGLFQKYLFLKEGYTFYLEVVEDKKRYRIRFEDLEQNNLDNKIKSIDEESVDSLSNIELLTHNTDSYTNITVKEGQRKLYLHYKIERNKENC